MSPSRLTDPASHKPRTELPTPEEDVPRITKLEKPALDGPAHTGSPPIAAERTLFVAVVHSGEGIRFMTAADSRRTLIGRVADYVRRWGPYVLHEDHVRHLRSLLARGELEAAVELYFGLVGLRWDKEWLVTAAVPADDPRGVLAVLGEVAPADVRGERGRFRAAS